MYEKYIQTYKHHAHTYGPSTVVFMLVGSFYELYDIYDAAGEAQTSMKRAVDILGIQLKVKKGDAPGGGDGLFAGFPESQLHKFAALLTRENWTVVVVDQEKDSNNKVTGRHVSRILSPGTHVEASPGDTFYLGGLFLEGDAWATETNAPPSFAAVAIDLTTGSITSYEGATRGRRDAWSSDELLHFFQVHPMKELTVWWRGHALDTPVEGTLRRILGIPSTLLHIRQANTLGPVAQKEIVREDLLRRCFKPKSLLPLREAIGLAGCTPTEIALCATLLFVEDHFPSAMDNLHVPRAWNPRDAMILGNHALTQLNMITGREEDSVLGLFTRTYTVMGRRAIRKRLLFPVCVEEELERRLDEVAWCQGKEGDLLATLRQIQDLARLHRRITTYQVNAVDVLALDQSYGCALRLAGQVASGPLAMPADLVHSFSALRAAFATVFSVEKALASSEELFCLTDEAGPATAAVERQAADKRGTLEATYTEIVDWLQETKELLRLDFKEASVQLTGGKKMMTHAAARLRAATPPVCLAGATINAKKSSSSMEVPSLQTLFSSILLIRGQLVHVRKGELPDVCDRFSADHIDTWEALEEWVSRVDVSFTLARVATERGFCRPKIVSSSGSGVAAAGSVDAKGLRHPLIEGQQTRTEYVRHDVALGIGEAGTGTNGWLVYGMNASGKSSLMKAVGIAVLLAQCGSFVPAESFAIQPFRALYTRILNTDNLWAGLSSFAVEMTELREVLVRADQAALVLGDEVCSGTESESATALVAATLERFQARGVRYIFATHLHGLQALPAVAGLAALRTWHLRVRHDPATGRLIYERTLQPGAGSSLYGLEVAKAMGLPEDVLESARRIRKTIAGTSTEEGAPASSWNTAIQRRACEACGAAIIRELEVHHVQERATASSSGRLADGTHMNNIRNLAVLCETCHDKHHAGELEVGSIQQTSEGPVRSIVDLRKFAHVPVKRAVAGGFSEEQIATIESYLRKYPSAPANRLLYDLKEKEEITITGPRLRAIRASLTL